MKTTRILAVPALAAASLLALTGCIQLPPMGGGTGDSGVESVDLAGTSWTGDLNGQVTDIAFTLAEDGTIDFSNWAGEEFDSPGDVWALDGETLEITITQIKVDQTSDETFDVTLSGSAAGGSMSLTGEGTDGNSYDMTASQD